MNLPKPLMNILYAIDAVLIALLVWFALASEGGWAIAGWVCAVTHAIGAVTGLNYRVAAQFALPAGHPARGSK
jgi:hypothetical protein